MSDVINEEVAKALECMQRVLKALEPDTETRKALAALQEKMHSPELFQAAKNMQEILKSLQPSEEQRVAIQALFKRAEEIREQASMAAKSINSLIGPESDIAKTSRSIGDLLASVKSPGMMAMESFPDREKELEELIKSLKI